MMSAKLGFLLAAVLSGATVAANATTILFSDFSSSTGLQLNGNAALAVDNGGRNVLRVTPDLGSQSGSAFSTNAVSLASNASFSTAFQFRIYTTTGGGACDGQGCGADGIVFAVQTVSNTAGGGGGGIGYQGLAHSVGVEFDTWNNGSIDGGSSNHVGVDLNGDVNSVARVNVTPDMNNGNIWSAWIDYNGVTDLLELRLAEGSGASRPTSALLSYIVDLTTYLGTTNAFVGFTSGTGAAWGNHDILAWQFNSTYDPIGTIGGGGTVPEPGTMALLLGAGAAFTAARRRKS